MFIAVSTRFKMTMKPINARNAFASFRYKEKLATRALRIVPRTYLRHSLVVGLHHDDSEEHGLQSRSNEPRPFERPEVLDTVRDRVEKRSGSKDGHGEQTDLWAREGSTPTSRQRTGIRRGK